MISRKTFIQQAGLLGAAVLIKPGMVSAAALPANKKIGLQLYSLRNQIVKDVPGVIAKVAQAGYTDVEPYGYSKKDKFWGMEPADFSKLLKANKLTSLSGHYGVEQYIGSEGNIDSLKAAIEAANVLGQTYVTVPHVADSLLKNADDYKVLADKLNKAGELCKSSKLKLAYHNHAVELESKDWGRGYDVLLQRTEPATVKFELDLYWAVRAGSDPVDIFKKHPGRFVMWHVKDMDKATPRLNTEIGSGSIDFKKIFKEARLAGLEQVYVEQENFSIDPYESIAKSYNYVHSNWPSY